jgi:hypothetical protein
MPNFVNESKVMKKGEEMFPNVIPKLEGGNPLRKGPPSQVLVTSCVSLARGAPPSS